MTKKTSSKGYPVKSYLVRGEKHKEKKPNKYLDVSLIDIQYFALSLQYSSASKQSVGWSVVWGAERDDAGFHPVWLSHGYLAVLTKWLIPGRR